ncbi:hypothetical protein V3C52_15070 [Escherichia coli]
MIAVFGVDTRRHSRKQPQSGNYIGISWRYQQPQAVKISANLVEVTPFANASNTASIP